MTNKRINISIVMMFVMCPIIGHSETLSVVTYNVLADETHRHIRVPKLFQLLKATDADIIALQEATQWFVEDLTKQDWLQKYAYPTKNGSMIIYRGLIILVKGKIHDATSEILPGKQGRALLIVDAEIKNLKFTIATCHLESYLKDGPTRADQLNIYFRKLGNKNNVIILGDFNFGDNESESERIPKAYVDMWKVLHNNKPGFTWNIEKSYMAKVGSFVNEESRRLDRIFYKSKRLNPIKIDIIGDKPVSANIFPSDHFGLNGIFKFIDSNP